MSSNQKMDMMRERDAEATEVSTSVPEETAPVVEGVHQEGTCADSAQVPDPMGTQTPPLKGPAAPELTGSPIVDTPKRRNAGSQKETRTKGLCVLHSCTCGHPPQNLSQLDISQA